MSKQRDLNFRKYGVSMSDLRVDYLKEQQPKLFNKMDSDAREFYKITGDTKKHDPLGRKRVRDERRENVTTISKTLRENFNPQKKIATETIKKSQLKDELNLTPEQKEIRRRKAAAKDWYELVNAQEEGDFSDRSGTQLSRDRLLRNERYAKEIGIWDIHPVAQQIEAERKETQGKKRVFGKAHKIKTNELDIRDLNFELKTKHRIKGQALWDIMKANPDLSLGTKLKKGQEIILPPTTFDPKASEILITTPDNTLGSEYKNLVGREEANYSIFQEAKARGLKLENGKWVQDKTAIMQKAEERGLKLVNGKWVKVADDIVQGAADEGKSGQSPTLPSLQSSPDVWIDNGPNGDGKEYSVQGYIRNGR